MTLALLLRPHASGGVVVHLTERLAFTPSLASFDDPAPLARPRRNP